MRRRGTLNAYALDRWITGNWGNDFWGNEDDFARCECCGEDVRRTYDADDCGYYEDTPETCDWCDQHCTKREHVDEATAAFRAKSCDWLHYNDDRDPA